MVALSIELRVTVKVSLFSTVVSPLTSTVMVLLVSLAPKDTVPLLLDEKSNASVLPVKVQPTVEVPSPLSRTIVKVNGVVVELPSTFTSSSAVIDTMGAAGAASSLVIVPPA
jgi:hypothetical protein